MDFPAAADTMASPFNNNCRQQMLFVWLEHTHNVILTSSDYN